MPHRLEELPGIDTQAGRARVLGRDAVYLRLLILFRDQHGEDMVPMRAALKAGQRSDLSALLHKLRGVASSLGANDVDRSALLMEELIEAGAQDAALELAMMALDRDLTKVVQGLQGLS